VRLVCPLGSSDVGHTLADREDPPGARAELGVVQKRGAESAAGAFTARSGEYGADDLLRRALRGSGLADGRYRLGGAQVGGEAVAEPSGGSGRGPVGGGVELLGVVQARAPLLAGQGAPAEQGVTECLDHHHALARSGRTPGLLVG